MDSYLFTKPIKIMGSYDVIVSGGGPAGFCAAIQAARAGAKTALIEQYGMLGGTATTGGNGEIGLFYAGSTQIISGIGWECVQRLAKRGWAEIPEFREDIPHSQQNVKVNIPMFAKLLDEMCEQADVDLFYHQKAVDVVLEGQSLKGIVISTKDGLQMLKSKIFIDCTGDGDIAARAGAQYELGDVKTGELQPGTLRFYLAGYDINQIDQEQVEACAETALKTGELTRNDFWGKEGAYAMFATMGNNINHIGGINGADSKSKTMAEIEARKSVERIVNWARNHVKGAENLQAMVIANEVAVRESRRILCDGYITVQDYLSAREYDDGICYSYYPIDLHRVGDTAIEQIFLEKGRVPQIPLSAMRVRGFDNLLVAGRCISGDRLANSAFRVKASCMAMGQSAGAVAAMAAKNGVNIRQVDIQSVKKLLRDNNAIVPNIQPDQLISC